MRSEVFVQIVHHRFDNAGGVNGGSVAMSPSLGMDDIGDAGAGSADGEPVAAAAKVGDQRLQLGLFADQEFDVVTGGPAQIPAAVLVGQVADFLDVIGADKTSRPDTHRVNLRSGFGNMNQNARLENFMVFPLPEVLFDNGREVCVIFWGTYIGNAVLHEIVRIKSHLLTS